MIEVLVVEPNKLPEKRTIPNKLESFQEIVGGYVECVFLYDRKDVALLCNEEGKIKKLKPCRDIGFDTICGNFIIVGVSDNDNEFHSLTKKQFKDMNYRFDETSLEELEFKLKVEKNRNDERMV